jgi:two-component system response regulator RegX3
MNARILLVDDEPDILETVGWALRRDGFDVSTAVNGETALETSASEQFDVVILDVMLPDIPGTDVCRRLREKSDVPILMLTARDAEVDRVLGLELGADDYVTKPFSTAELASRVRAILRRRELDRAPRVDSARVVGDLRIDPVRHEVSVGDRLVALTPSEFRLLSLLADHLGQPLSRNQIMEHLWRSPYVGDARACDTHIANLRRKIEIDHAHPTRLVTVREVGYKLVAG